MDALVALRDGLAREPTDWESWLVYADWLLDRGDPRGDLVNLEHKLDTAKLSRDERLGLVRRRTALQKEHQDRWLQGLTLPAQLYPRWRHGFIIGLTPGSFAKGLKLEALLSFLPRLQAHPTGLLLCTLDLSELRLGDAEAAQVASAPLGPLTRLLLGSNQIGPKGAASLSQSAHLGALRRLDLSRNALGARGAEALAACQSLAGLQELHLSHNELGDEGAHALSGAGLPSLERLGLQYNGIGDPGAYALADSVTLRSLQELLLQGNPLSPEALTHLTELSRRYLAARR